MKKSEAKEYIKELIVAELSEATEELDDIEPTAKDIAANASIARLQSKYGEVIKQMKSVVNKYKSAEGTEKQKYVDQLKDLTKLKKELEAMINPSIDDEDEE
jgi:predicted RecB family endonuclease